MLETIARFKLNPSLLNQRFFFQNLNKSLFLCFGKHVAFQKKTDRGLAV